MQQDPTLCKRCVCLHVLLFNRHVCVPLIINMHTYEHQHLGFLIRMLFENDDEHDQLIQKCGISHFYRGDNMQCMSCLLTFKLSGATSSFFQVRSGLSVVQEPCFLLCMRLKTTITHLHQSSIALSKCYDDYIIEKY